MSPERGIKRLVQEAMLLTAPHVHRFVDEIHLVLLETVREAARRSVLTEAGIPLGSGPEPGKGMEFLRLKGFENAVIQAATKALDEWKAEAHKGGCRATGVLKGGPQERVAASKPGRATSARQTARQPAAHRQRRLACALAAMMHLYRSLASDALMTLLPLSGAAPCLALHSRGDDGADGVRLRDALLLPRAGEGVPERADERGRRAGRRCGAARRPHGAAGARCAAAGGGTQNECMTAVLWGASA